MNGMLSVTPTLALARIVHVSVTDDTLAADLEDGRSIAVPIGWYPRLSHARPEERANFVISGAVMASTGLIWMRTSAWRGCCWARNRARARRRWRGGWRDEKLIVEAVIGRHDH